MTKALICFRCSSLRSFLSDGSITACDCGLIRGWWQDAASGTARLYTETTMGRRFGRVLGVNNAFLREAAGVDPERRMPDGYYRHLHERATQAPGYLFDQTRRNCWAVVIAPGESADTRWATDEEWETKRLTEAEQLVGRR